jgi:hypothetical protein
VTCTLRLWRYLLCSESPFPLLVLLTQTTE